MFSVTTNTYIFPSTTKTVAKLQQIIRICKFFVNFLLNNFQMVMWWRFIK